MFPCLETKTIAKFCFKQIFSNVCQYFVAIFDIFFYKTHTKNCFSLTCATDLKCYCITVQFYVALQWEVQEVDVIRTVLMQM